MTRTLLLLALVGAPLAGCARGADDHAAHTDAPASASATADDTLVLRGRVAEVLYDGDALRVDHEAVPTLGMDAMRMDFRLAERALADGLAPGDLVAMTIEAAPRLRVTEIQRLPAGTPLVLADASPAMADTARAMADTLGSSVR